MIKTIKKIIKSNYLWIIFFICILLFLALAEDVFTHEIMKGDIIGYNLVSKYLIKTNITPIVKYITWFGSATCLILISLLSFVIKNKKISICILSNLVIITILNQLFKFIFERPRPTEYRIITETGYSFPSGHSMVSMAFYGFIIYLIYKKVNNKYIKWIFISILSLLIVSIGISRIYLGVHYTSDVLAGFLISISYLIIYIKYTKKIIDKDSNYEK